MQGVGSVGGRLVELLHEAGAALVVADVDPARAKETAELVDAATVEARGTSSAPSATCTRRARPAVCCRRRRSRGCAAGWWPGPRTTSSREPHDAELLAERGILYAPDFVINAGGVLHLAGYETLRWTEEQMAARLAGIGDTLLEVYDAADREGITTDAAANRLARSRLNAARTG